jgi:hypothetical protein
MATAMRDGFFLCNRAKAAEALGIPLSALIAIVRGQAPVGSHVLARLCLLSRCPPRWFTDGDMQRMPIGLAVRVRLILGEEH